MALPVYTSPGNRDGIKEKRCVPDGGGASIRKPARLESKRAGLVLVLVLLEMAGGSIEHEHEKEDKENARGLAGVRTDAPC
jgi:hypothetical protein